MTEAYGFKERFEKPSSRLTYGYDNHQKFKKKLLTLFVMIFCKLT